MDLPTEDYYFSEPPNYANQIIPTSQVDDGMLAIEDRPYQGHHKSLSKATLISIVIALAVALLLVLVCLSIVSLLYFRSRKLRRSSSSRLYFKARGHASVEEQALGQDHALELGGTSYGSDRRHRTAFSMPNDHDSQHSLPERLPLEGYGHEKKAKAASEDESLTPLPPLQPSICAICSGGFRNGEPYRIMPHCRHTVHYECIDPWLSKSPACPSCRKVLKSSYN